MSRNILFLLVAICCSTESFHFRKSKTTIYEVDHEADVGSPLFLTLFLQRGMYKKAQQLSKVNPDIGNMTSYSGLFTVNKECNSNLYFWFFPAQKPNWQEAPLVLWLQGGPGESSLFGLFTELGPFEVFDKNLRKREYSWNVENNLLFIDQPVGAGFSFTGKECYPENETAVGADLYEALVQFYQLFPVLQKNKFFITGESYAGHYIPALGYTIHKNNPSAKVKINLAAMMIGNGWMDPVSQIDYGSYLYQHGLIDDSVKEVYKSQQELFVKQVESENFDAATATCKGFTGHLFDRFVGNVSVYNLLLPDTEDDNWAKFLNSSEIRKALHVGNLTYYSYSRVVSSHLEWDQVQSVKPWVEELLEYYPMIFYNGQLDIICAYPMMINFLQSLSWEGDAAYLNATRTKWCVGNLVTPEMYEQHLAKSVAQAENKIGNAFHCKTPDCPGWCIFEDNVNTFQCPVCSQVNCLTCQVIHTGMDCKQFQEKAQQEAETNADARRTREMLEEMVQRGEALPCPTCHVVLMKKWGCDWLRCSMCKTEICWVTRGPRWGPGGKGDTSAGCKCGVNGIKCHPKCNYCH